MPLPAGGNFAGQIAALRTDLPPDFAIGYSGDWGCPDALLNHADGWFSVAAGLWPDQTLTLACAARAGDRPETARWQARFQPMWDLFQAHGSLRVVHACARLMDLTDAQPPRPILPLPDALTPRLRAARCMRWTTEGAVCASIPLHTNCARWPGRLQPATKP